MQAGGSPSAKQLWTWQQTGETQGRQTKVINRKLWRLLPDLGKFLTWH